MHSATACAIVLDRLTGHGRITEADVDAAMREIRLALLEADVNYKVVKDFVGRVKERAIGQDVLEGINAGQLIVKIVHDELTAILGAGDRTFRLNGSPAVIALVGLQGSGKTTSAAKLARYIVRQGRQPMLVAADPYRPAAVDQLRTLGKSLDLPVYSAPPGTSVVDIARGGIAEAKRTGRDVVILDTAGRLTVDEALMAEIRDVAQAVQPTETLLVVDAMVGPGGGAGRGGVPRRGRDHGPHPDQDRWRRARWSGAVHQRGHGRAGQVHGHGREDRRARGLPSRPAGRSDPGHG